MSGATYIGPEARCCECGGLATRMRPEGEGLVGCDGCYPQWPKREAGK